MPSTTTDQQIRSLVDSVVADLTQLVHKEALRLVQEAVGGTPPGPKRRGPGRPRKKAKATRRKTGGKRVRRSTASVEAVAARALAYIRSHDGCSVGDIATALRLTSKDLQLPIKKLIADRKVRTTGQKRGTKYHAGRGPAKKKATRTKAAKRKTTKKKRAAKKAKRKTAKRRGKKKASRKRTTKRKTKKG